MNPNSNNQAGKGDAPRPVNLDVYAENYEAIFRKQTWPYDPDPFTSPDHDDDETIYNETIQ